MSHAGRDRCIHRAVSTGTAAEHRGGGELVRPQIGGTDAPPQECAPTMIRRVHWSQIRPSHSASPFHFATQRPLNITFHSSSFAQASPEEISAIELLRELVHRPSVAAMDTEASAMPHLQIGEYYREATRVDVTVAASDHTTVSTIEHPGTLMDTATLLASPHRKRSVDAATVFRELLIAQAHVRFGYDILVTLSPTLLENDKLVVPRFANPRAPTEAVRIVGSLLRSRNDFTYRASGRARGSVDRGLYYWILARHRLPGMWRYVSACAHAAAFHNDATSRLGSSVLSRVSRSLEARDAIGVQFYTEQSNSTRDATMYHFDYLTVLLAGALDAQAQVAKRAYGLPKQFDRSSSFRHRDFVDALGKSGASKLHILFAEQRTQDLLTLLFEVRNTIHSANLPTIACQRSGGYQESFVHVPPQIQERIRTAAERLNSLTHWGLQSDDPAFIEPYSFATSLVDACLQLVNDVAASTEVAGLFPDRSAVPELMDVPPADGVWAEQIRQRLAMLW